MRTMVSDFQCWGSHFLKVIYYSYKLHGELSNLLQLLCYFYYCNLLQLQVTEKVTCYFSVTFDRPANFLFMAIQLKHCRYNITCIFRFPLIL